MTLWAIPCHACHHTFALFESERLPKISDPVDFDKLRDLYGEPISMDAVACCFSCGASPRSLVATPLDWARLDAPPGQA